MFPLDAFRNTLSKAVALFEQHTIRFHLTGALTSVVYGEPRMTQDLDLVIDNQAVAGQLDAFVASVESSDFLFDESSIRQAVDRHGMFQLYDRIEALKLDIYPRELIPGELNRSQMWEVFEGMLLPIASRADAAVSKLVWISKGSHKNRRDVRHIHRAATAEDRQRIRDLAGPLGLETLLDEVLGESDEMIE
ncbi:MAG: nucleotidyl transferase AbiEii/AbiGii toxin family protein [Pirellulaceae bacterium]